MTNSAASWGSVTFTEEILNTKLHFLCSVGDFSINTKKVFATIYNFYSKEAHIKLNIQIVRVSDFFIIGTKYPILLDTIFSIVLSLMDVMSIILGRLDAISKLKLTII